MRALCTWIAVRGLTEGGGEGWAGSEKGKNWDNCNSINNKILTKIKENHVRPSNKIATVLFAFIW